MQNRLCMASMQWNIRLDMSLIMIYDLGSCERAAYKIWK